MGSGKNLQREIDDLRAQLERLTRQATQSTDSETQSPRSAEGGPAGPGESSVVTTKLEELLDVFKRDLQELPATSAVAIFALGVVFGRVLSK